MDRDTITPKVKTIPGSNTKKWTKFHMRYASESTYEPEFVWDRSAPAIGPFCTDADGNILMDFVSHIGSSPLGYNNPEIAELMHRMKTVEPDRYAGADFIASYGKNPSKSSIPTPSHLHHKLRDITKHHGLDTSFFSNSGAEAVENAIKICYDYKKNAKYGVCFEGAFHGRTLGALSLNRSKEVYWKGFPSIPNIVSLPYCACKKERNDGCNCISKTKKILRSRNICNKMDLAYFIIEPVQGESGYIIPNKDYVQEIYELSRKYDARFISDEVQSGMGRTGKWWAIEHFKIRPDVMSSAKALRIGATIGRKKYFPEEKGRISSTWGEGNAIASAVGYKTIEIIQKKNLLHNAETKGKYFISRLKELENKFRFVKDAGGLGLMDRIELDTPQRRDNVIKESLKKGLLLIGAGHRSIRFLPPLNVTKREIDIAVEILEESVRKCE